MEAANYTAVSTIFRIPTPVVLRVHVSLQDGYVWFKSLGHLGHLLWQPWNNDAVELLEQGVVQFVLDHWCSVQHVLMLAELGVHKCGWKVFVNSSEHFCVATAQKPVE